MLHSDPFPDKVVLTGEEVRRMLGFKATAWKDFLAANQDFPKPIVIGKTKKGREIRKYPKAKVFAYLELKGG